MSLFLPSTPASSPRSCLTLPLSLLPDPTPSTLLAANLQLTKEILLHPPHAPSLPQQPSCFFFLSPPTKATAGDPGPHLFIPKP